MLNQLPQGERYLSGTVSEYVSDSATSFDVNNPPATDKLPTYIELEPDSDNNRELVRVIGVSGNTITVERGIDNGGTGVEHQTNSTYKQKITSRHWDAVVDALESGYLTEDNSFTFSQVSSSTFRIATSSGDDRTSIYTVGRRVRLNGSVVCRVVSSSYSNPNTDVVTDGTTVPATITSIEVEIGTHGGVYDGWIAPSDTWTYASATTFTIAGVDRTAMFPKGTKLKLTQTTAKYFYVVGSAFSTNTTITITGGTDYTLANAAITSPYYSYASCPQGHPIWFNFAFTPVWNASAVPTGTPSTLDNKLMISGSSCTVDVYHDGYAAGTGVTAFSFTLPVVPLFSGSASGAITAGPSLNTCYSNHTTTIGRVYCSSVAATRVSFGATYAF